MTYQRFLNAMMGTSDAKLARADVEKLAAKYGVDLEWARMTLERWRARG